MKKPLLVTLVVVVAALAAGAGPINGCGDRYPGFEPPIGWGPTPLRPLTTLVPAPSTLLYCVRSVTLRDIPALAAQAARNDIGDTRTGLGLLMEAVAKYQKAYHEHTGRYAGTLQELGISVGSGIQVQITSATADGWTGRGRYSSQPGECVVFDGNISKPLTTRKSRRAPAARVPICE